MLIMPILFFFRQKKRGPCKTGPSFNKSELSKKLQIRNQKLQLQSNLVCKGRHVFCQLRQLV